MSSVKKITTVTDCMNCEDQCCEFRKSDIYFAPLFTKSDVNKITKHLKINPKIYFRSHKGSKNIFQIKLQKPKNSRFYYCPFLDRKTQRCTVYKLCPLDCKMWPFFITWSKNKKRINLVCYKKEYCPALENISNKKFMEYFFYLLKVISEKKFINFLKKNPEYIWDHEEGTFVVKDITDLLKQDKKDKKTT